MAERYVIDLHTPAGPVKGSVTVESSRDHPSNVIVEFLDNLDPALVERLAGEEATFDTPFAASILDVLKALAGGDGR